MKRIITVILLLGSLVWGQTPVEKYGKLQIKGTNLCDQNGKPVQLRGLSTHGIQWFDSLYTENAMQALAQGWKCDIVRLSLYARSGGYETNPTYFTNRVDQLIEWATKYGMYVMIDWHQLVPGDPNTDIVNAKKYFEYMSSKHGAKINVIFEICNEPNDVQSGDYLTGTKVDVTWDYHIKPYADQIIPIIRKHSPQNIIVVGTPKWASRPNDVIGNKVNDAQVMYTLHFYAASHSFEYNEWWPSYMDNMREAISAGLPVFATEFGTQEATGDGSNNFVASKQWLDSLAKYNVSWCNWNFSDDYRTGAAFKENAVSGTSSVADFSNPANMKDAGKWVYEYLRKSVSITNHAGINQAPFLSMAVAGKILSLSAAVPAGSSIALFDLTGRKILDREIAGTSVTLSNLAKGIFIAEIMVGKSSVVQKIRID